MLIFICPNNAYLYNELINTHPANNLYSNLDILTGNYGFKIVSKIKLILLNFGYICSAV